MLKIFWGVTEDCYYYIDREYKNEFEMEWFRDKDVLQIINDIDHCTYDGFSCVNNEDPSIRFPLSGLSTGSKGLILLLKMEYDEIRIWGSAFGDNCAEWLLKIAEKKNIIFELEHFFHFPEEGFKAYSCHQKRMFEDYRDYKMEVFKYGYKSWGDADFRPEVEND